MGDTLNGNGDGKICEEKHNSELKKVILSPTEFEDNERIDMFQAEAIDTSRDIIPCRGQDLVIYR